MMTIRSVVLGMLGAMAICAVTYLNDRVLNGTYLVGNSLPVVVYGLLIVAVLIVNPLVRRFALSGKELAVILAFVLVACTIPASGLMGTFSDVLLLPHYHARTTPGWHGGVPWVQQGDVENWEALVAKLKKGEGPVWDAMRRNMPPGFAAQLPDTELTLKEKERVLREINNQIRDKKLLEEGLYQHCDFSEYVDDLTTRDQAKLTDTAAQIVGRAIVDSAAVKIIKPRKMAILENVHPRMLVDTATADDSVVNGFVAGKKASLSELPWGAWRRTLMFWIPLVLCMWIIVISISMVVHRQWSSHEHLPYPVASFANSLMPEEGLAVPSLFQQRSFWVAGGLILVVHLNNYGQVWFPKYFVQIPTSLDFSALRELFPWFRGLLRLEIYFIAVGLAFFIPRDVLFTMGAGPFLWAIVAGMLARHGVNLDNTVGGSSPWISVTPRAFVTFGGCLGIFLAISYIGRHYYSRVFGAALGFNVKDKPRIYEVWSARSLLFFMAAFVLQLVFLAKLGFGSAIAFAVVMIVSAVITARVIAETGLFHIQIPIFPCVIMWGLMGERALGLKALLIMQLITVVLLLDPREALMPFVVNSLKLLERRKVTLWKPATGMVAALLLGLTVALPVTLYIQYNHGLSGDYWSEMMAPKFPFRNALWVRNRLEAQGIDATASSDQGIVQSVTSIRPKAICLWAAGIGMFLAIATMAARLRWSWWPIHPLLFALWGTSHFKYFAGSFLFGWLIKTAVIKYGGTKTFNSMKPLMLGLIAGEVFGAMIPCVVALLVWLITGEMPKTYRILPL